MLNSWKKFIIIEYQSAVTVCSALTLCDLLCIESMEWLIL